MTTEVEDEDGSNLVCSLLDKLNALQITTNSATPITEALRQIKLLRKIVLSTRKNERTLKLYAKASQAINELMGIKTLIELQVNSLLEKLSAKTIEWKNLLYQPASASAPEIASTEVTTDGAIEIMAKIGSTKTLAHHISNASDLRATLLALLLAFWEHLLNERGGLSLIILDDVQELFDKTNRRRLANTIPKIASVGGDAIVTSNDHVFGRRLAKACGFESTSSIVDRFRIHSLIPIRSHIELSNFIEHIEAKRKEFEKPGNVDEEWPAQEYVNQLRIYLEERLKDFFPDEHSGLPIDPPLSDLINAIRTRRQAGQEPFNTQVFVSLLSSPALKQNSVFLKLMNKSHHGDAREITYKEVEGIEYDCISVRKLVDFAHEGYELWMQRDCLSQESAKPEVPESSKTISFNVPLINNVAAASFDNTDLQVVDDGLNITDEYLGEYAVYILNTDNYGFSAMRNNRVIVGLTDNHIPDNSLVIALRGTEVYARRLLRYDNNPSIVALSPEVQDPRRRPPSLLLPAEEVRLLQVIGLVFDNTEHWPRPNGEAKLIDSYNLSENVNIVCEIQGYSAMPLALPGQKILLGDSLLPEKFDNHKGTLVALALSDSKGVFKRIGESISGLPHLRLFESIGGLGESILAKTEDFDGSDHGFSGLPVLQNAYKVLGVLYEQNNQGNL